MQTTMINKEAKLSEHFTLGEMTKTDVKGVDNTPSHGAVLNLKNLCENWLEDLRYSYNALYVVQTTPDPIPEQSSPTRSLSYSGGEMIEEEPIIINSGYRSPAVNKAINGAAQSNHLTGCAVDIRCLGIEQAIRYASILLDIADGTRRDFDELLIERSSKGNYWLHFAVRPKDNRRKTAFRRG